MGGCSGVTATSAEPNFPQGYGLGSTGIAAVRESVYSLPLHPIHRLDEVRPGLVIEHEHAHSA